MNDFVSTEESGTVDNASMDKSAPRADLTECPDDCANAALFWYRFGLQVIPLRTETKATAAKWESWLGNLCEQGIAEHWKRRPDHEVGAILDDRWLVLDADNEQQHAKLIEIERACDVEPNMIVRTRKGEHHWFRRSTNTYARQCSFSTEIEPHKIDVKTGRTDTEGRGMVVLPPSTGKEIVLLEADSADDLTEIDQVFIDAVFKHNGMEPPREVERTAPAIQAPPKEAGEVLEILGHIDPACGYEQWCRIGMALHDKFAGSDEGLAVYIEWSSEAPNAASPEEIEYKWRSFTAGSGITFASVAQMAASKGADLAEIASRYHSDGTVKATFDELLEAANGLDPESEGIEDLIRDAAHLGPVEKRRIHDRIKAKTKLPLTVIREQERTGSDGEGPPDHLAIARQLISEIGQQNLLSTDAFVYQWKGTGVWEKQRERAVKQWVQHFIGEGGKVEAVAKSNVESIADLFRTEVFNPHQEFDIGPAECVNVQNGELVLNGDWTLEPHCREHYRTTQLPVSYDPSAIAPQFEQFLNQVFAGDPDAEQKKTALLEMMGYTLMAHCRHERFVILIGSGANGKSVLLFVLERLCGRANVSGVQPSQFDNKFQRAHLHGKLANIVSELREGAVIDDDALKGITSGETTTVEHKHKDPFDMRPFSTCWFGTNHLPHTRDFSDALFRRAVLLEFNQVFKPELGNCDPEMKEKLIGELPGILNMSLAAYANAISNGFTMPESCRQAREKWRLEADQVAQFVEESCHLAAGASATVADLYRAYKCWSDDAGIRNRLGRRTFTDRLIRLGVSRGREAGTGKTKIQGIGLKAECNHVVPERWDSWG